MKLKSGREFRIYKPELFKLCIALGWLCVVFDWTQSPYTSMKVFNIHINWG